MLASRHSAERGVVRQTGKAPLIAMFRATWILATWSVRPFWTRGCVPFTRFFPGLVRPGHQTSDPYRALGTTIVVTAFLAAWGGTPEWTLHSPLIWLAIARAFLTRSGMTEREGNPKSSSATSTSRIGSPGCLATAALRAPVAVPALAFDIGRAVRVLRRLEGSSGA